jgi:hypothetical protein
MKLAVALLASTLAAAPCFAGEPTGQYSVQGANPGGQGQYSGRVDVTRTGDTFRVVWQIGNQRFVGTGIGTDEAIAVSYSSGNSTGLAIYLQDGDGWRGVWTYAGGTQLGTENWARR